MSDSEAVADRRLEEALSRHGVQDMRPLYRQMLRRLRSVDEGAYESAVERYREELLPALADGAGDPLALWVRYGAHLAGRLSPGHVVAVDPTGRAERPAEIPVPGALLLHLPEETRQPAWPLMEPREPSPPQRATRDLLCG